LALSSYIAELLCAFGEVGIVPCWTLVKAIINSHWGPGLEERQ